MATGDAVAWEMRMTKLRERRKRGRGQKKVDRDGATAEMQHHIVDGNGTKEAWSQRSWGKDGYDEKWHRRWQQQERRAEAREAWSEVDRGGRQRACTAPWHRPPWWW